MARNRASADMSSIAITQSYLEHSESDIHAVGGQLKSSPGVTPELWAWWVSCIRPIHIPELRLALGSLKAGQWVVFTSQHAIEIFFKALSTLDISHDVLSKVRWATVGPTTLTKLKACLAPHQLTNVPIVSPDIHNARSLAERLLATEGSLDILFPRGERGGETFIEAIRQTIGHHLNTIVIYDNVVADAQKQAWIRNALASHRPDVLGFTAPSSVDHLTEIIAGRTEQPRSPNFEQTLKQIAIGCMSESIAKKVKAQGYDVAFVSESSHLESLIGAAQQWIKAHATK